MKHRILFLAANPLGTDRLALDEDAPRSGNGVQSCDRTRNELRYRNENEAAARGMPWGHETLDSSLIVRPRSTVIRATR